MEWSDSRAIDLVRALIVLALCTAIMVGLAILGGIDAQMVAGR